MSGWIGVDLDGTLAIYDGWMGHTHIGPPIPEMVARIKGWLAEGKTVKIFTARAASRHNEAEYLESIKAIEDYCLEHIGVVLEVTCQKDYGMTELWDDRAVQVIPNKGIALQTLIPPSLRW